MEEKKKLGKTKSKNKERQERKIGNKIKRGN
jgi:hypothetical protein